MGTVALDHVIAGGTNDFMAVRHIVMKGTQNAIGAALAKIARADLNVVKEPWTDPIMTRAQKLFLARNWPQHFERMKGVAEAYGADLDDASLDFSFLAYDAGLPGCSCVYYPASSTCDGHSVVSRNFDYTTGGARDLALAGGAFGQVPAGNRPFCARPFLLETYPEEGYATLGMCAFDLLGCLTDGVNEKGLCVALLNDSETVEGPAYEPIGMNAVGLSEAQVPKFLLETCANVDEALTALLVTKQCYISSPNHYLVGDSTGRGFIWQYSAQRNKPRIIACGETPLAVTNHQLSVQRPATPPVPGSSRGRLQVLHDAVAKPSERYRREEIRDINSRVQGTSPVGTGQYASATHPSRTLWYAYYDLDARSVELDFYLGDESDRIRRSRPKRFRLGEHRETTSNG